MFTSLTDLYNDWDHVIITAHRGASGIYPENTAFAMRKAIGFGTDMIEFDLQMTKDGVPIILHDETLDRTSNLTGKPADYTLAELKRGNFAYRKHDGEPLYENIEIPTFEELLREFRGQAGMNIQVYAPPSGLKTICELYCDYDMYDLGYLTIASRSDFDFVRAFNPKIDICFTPGWKERTDPANLQLCKDLGCRFCQPVVAHATAEAYALCRQLGLRANGFYADTEGSAKRAVALGATGLLTNRCDILIDTLNR